MQLNLFQKPTLIINIFLILCPNETVTKKKRMQKDVERTQQQPNLSRRSRSDRMSTTGSHSKRPTRLRQKGTSETKRHGSYCTECPRQHKLSFQTSSQHSRPSSHRPLSLSFTPNFCSNVLVRTTRRSGEN